MNMEGLYGYWHMIFIRCTLIVVVHNGAWLEGNEKESASCERAAGGVIGALTRIDKIHLSDACC